MVWQVTNKADRVAKQHIVAIRELPPLNPGRERGEQLVMRKGAASGERIEKAGLPRIGVSDESHCVVVFVAVKHFAFLAGVDAVEFLLQLAQTLLHEPAIDFELLLTRPTRSDANRRAAGERFNAAMELAATEKTDEAFKAFADIAADGNEGYQLLARFSQARLLSQNGNSRDASLAYRVLADDVSIDSLYRDLAVILGAYEDLNSQGADTAEMKERLKPLMAKTNPWRFSAQEITGLLSRRSGDKTKARELFTALVNDRNTPQGVRTRAQEMLSILGK